MMHSGEAAEKCADTELNLRHFPPSVVTDEWINDDRTLKIIQNRRKFPLHRLIDGRVIYRYQVETINQPLASVSDGERVYWEEPDRHKTEEYVITLGPELDRVEYLSFGGIRVANIVRNDVIQRREPVQAEEKTGNHLRTLGQGLLIAGGCIMILVIFL